MNWTVQIWNLQFIFLSKASISYNKTLISLSWLSDGIELSTFIKSFNEDFLHIIEKLAP